MDLADGLAGDDAAENGAKTPKTKATKAPKSPRFGDGLGAVAGRLLDLVPPLGVALVIVGVFAETHLRDELRKVPGVRRSEAVACLPREVVKVVEGLVR